MYISDEAMQFLTDMLGKIYLQWYDLNDSTIDRNDTFSYLFRRTEDFLNNRPVIYSIYSGGDETNLITSKSSTDDNLIIISDGQIIDQNNDTVQVLEHTLSVSNLYPYIYPSDGHYGVIVGFYYDDIDAVSDIKQTKITTDITAGTYTDGSETRIPVENPSTLTNAEFPVIMNIGTENIVISGYIQEIVGSSTITKAIVSDEYNTDGITGTTMQSHSSDSIAFIYRKLEASLVFGAPVGPAHQSGGTAANFDYFPPVPSDMIEIARVLVENPMISTGGAVVDNTNILDIYDTRTIGDSSEDVPFTTTEKNLQQEILDDISSSIDSINFQSTLASTIDSLNDISYTDETGTTSGTFSDYWNNRPVERSTFFIYGNQWDNLERFEVNRGFRQLWYDTLGEELLTTFGIFSGNLMDTNNNSTISAPEILDNNPDPPYQTKSDPANGAITPGDWIYAISVVTSAGESPLSNFKVIRVPTFSQYNTITLRWDAIPGALYYHVYRKNSQLNLVNDIRLTNDYEVTTTEYIDDGSSSGQTTRRGIILTTNTTLNPEGSRMYAYVPVISDDVQRYPIQALEDDITSTTGSTQNGFRLNLTLVSADNTLSAITVSIPRGTPAGTSIPIGTESYVGIKDAQVELIDGEIELVGNRINWSIQDRVYLQNIEI